MRASRVRPPVEAALRMAFLGSSGSFSEEAALIHAARISRAVELINAHDPAGVLAHLAAGTSDLAVLPVANTTGGLVRPALAAMLAAGCELCDEVELPVRFSLWTRRPGTSAGDLARVASHPQAFAQCARALERLLPGCLRLDQGDTASAARALADGDLGERTAVLCSTRAGERYGLALLAADVHDEPGNRTLFAVLRRRPAPPAEKTRW